MGLAGSGCVPNSSDNESAGASRGASAEVFAESLDVVLAMPLDLDHVNELVALLGASGPETRQHLQSVVQNRYGVLDPIDHLLLLRAWAKLDPEAATSWARAAAPTSIREAAEAYAIREWAFQEGMVAARRLPTSETGIGRAVVSGWFDSGKPGLPEFVLGQGSGQAGQLLISAYLRQLIARDGVAAARSWAESVEGDEKMQWAVYRHTGKEMATVDPEAAISFCDAHCNEPEGNSLRLFVARRIGEIGEGQRALEWIAEAEDADTKERLQAARAAFREWIISDRSAAVDCDR